MCLYLRERRPRVAKKDITVLKYVKLSDGGMVSPFQYTRIPANKVMKASPESVSPRPYSEDIMGNNIYCIDSGAIHAKLEKDSSFSNSEGRKAIIPAGTEYWLSVDGTEIAARSMIITDIDWNKEGNKVSENLFEEILENAPEANGIKVGDYLLEDGDYTRPRKGLSKNEVVGIVVGFVEGEPLIAALDRFTGAFDTQYSSQFGEYHTSNKEAIQQFNGKDITKKYKEGKREARFEAFETCLKYRSDKDEEWYYGAAGEVATMINNCIYINAAHHITGLGFTITHEGWYSSCSEDSLDCSWYCCLRYYEVYCLWYYKSDRCRVVPFLASKKPTEKKKMNSLTKWIKKLWK